MLVPASASACTCPSSGAAVAWPVKDAVDVPLDTPIVVRRYNLSGPTDDLGYALIDAEGKEVPLVEAHRLPPAFEGCGQEEIVFMRPENPLDPHATYRMTIDSDVDSEQQFGSTFKTGEMEFEPEAEIDAELRYLRVTQESKDCPVGQCLSLAEAYVDLGDRPKVPRWFRVESGGVDAGRNAFTFWPQDSRTGSSWELSVLLQDDDPCIDVDVYGVEGVPLFHERRCEPDRCARYSRWGQSTCGNPPSSGVDATRIHEGTCSDPPVLGFKVGTGVVYPKASLTPKDSTARSSGCSATSTTAGAWWVPFSAALLLRRARKAR
jgi:hypothetical protein